MKKWYYRTAERLVACFEIMSCRTFNLESSASKPGDFCQVKNYSSIMHDDY